MQYLKQLKIEFVDTDRPNPLKGQVRDASQIVSVFDDMKSRDKNTIVGVYLDDRLEINSFDVLSIGGMDFEYLSPKEVFKAALLTNSSNFIILHNHAHGDPEPTPQDQEFLEKLKEQSKIMDIHIIDFIIIGDGEPLYWSWQDTYNPDSHQTHI